MSLAITAAQLGRPAGTSLANPALTNALRLATGGVQPTVSRLNVGSIIGGIGSIAGGGPILPGVIDIAQGIFGGGGSQPAPQPQGPATTGTATGGCINVGGFSWCGGVSAGPGSGFQSNTPVQSAPQIPAGVSPRGYHPNKTGYWTSQGYVPKGTKMVRNRRRNPLNPRALSRSLSRITGFDRATRSVEKRLAKVARHAAPRRAPARRTSSCGCKK